MGQGLHIMGYFAEWDFEICGGLMKMEMCVEAWGEPPQSRAATKRYPGCKLHATQRQSEPARTSVPWSIMYGW